MVSMQARPCRQHGRDRGTACPMPTNSSTLVMVLQACVQAAGRWCSGPACPAPGPSSSYGPEALLWLWDMLSLSLLQVAPWSSASFADPSWGIPPQPGLPNATIFNMSPCICQAGQCFWQWAVCPCAASSSPGRPCAPLLWLQGQTEGTCALPAWLWF